jgi:hypothetical protein
VSSLFASDPFSPIPRSKYSNSIMFSVITAEPRVRITPGQRHQHVRYCLACAKSCGFSYNARAYDLAFRQPDIIQVKSYHHIQFMYKYSIHILFNSYSSYSIHIIIFNTHKHTVVFAEEWCSSVQIIFV